MRTRWAVLFLVLALLLQLAWPAGTSIYAVVPNFMLVYVVVLSVFVDTKLLLWIAFAGGLVLDMASVAQFGLNMAFYILLVLVLKLVWRLDQRSLHYTNLVGATLLATIAYALLAHISLLSTQYAPQWHSMLIRLFLECVYNGLITAGILGVLRLRQRGIIGS